MVFVWKVNFFIIHVDDGFRLSCAHNLAGHNLEISIKYST